MSPLSASDLYLSVAKSDLFDVDPDLLRVDCCRRENGELHRDECPLAAERGWPTVKDHELQQRRQAAQNAGSWNPPNDPRSFDLTLMTSIQGPKNYTFPT